MNRGLQLVRGEYIYFSAADDRILPGFFKKSMKLLSEYPEAGMCFTNVNIFKAKSGETLEASKHWLAKPGYISPFELSKMIDGGTMCGTTWITRRDRMVELGGYRPELKWHCDWFLHHVIAFRYGTCFVPEALTIWRSDRTGTYSSNQYDPTLQRSVFLALIKILLTPEYQDIIPFIGRARMFRAFRNALTWSSIFDALKEVKSWNQSVRMLFCYLLWEMNQPYRARAKETVARLFDHGGSKAHRHC